MTLTVITGMWGERREEYAACFSAGFDAHWPKDVRLVIYADGPLMVPDRAEVRLLDECTGYTAFMTRHAGDPVKCGRKAGPGATWKEGARRKGYNFRFDAMRFAGQAFIPDDAGNRLLDGDVLCWLDADVATYKDVPEGFVEGLVAGTDGAYLGRDPKHSEIGFWAVRMHEGTQAMMMAFADAYRDDHIFAMKEWHSAYVWDESRRWAERTLGVGLRNLTPGGSGHVWFQSPLRYYMDHLKGDRKAKGRSPERKA
jgi:hypothetical protein